MAAMIQSVPYPSSQYSTTVSYRSRSVNGCSAGTSGFGASVTCIADWTRWTAWRRCAATGR